MKHPMRLPHSLFLGNWGEKGMFAVLAFLFFGHADHLLSIKRVQKK